MQRWYRGGGEGVGSRVRHHFHFEAKWSETEAKFFSLWCEKTCFFRLFRISAKLGNLKWNENETKQNKTKKAKRKQIFFASMQKSVSSHLKWIENEMKQKQNEKEAKTSKRKRIKLNSGTICKEIKKNFRVGLLAFQVYT